MIDMQTLEGAKRAIGVENLRNAGRARNIFYAVPFVGTAIAAGGTASITQKIDNSYAFVASAFTGILHDGAGAAIAASELVTVELTANDGSYFFAAVPWDCIIGTAVQPHFPLFAPVFPPGASVVVKINNSTAVSITPTVTLIGHRLGV